MKDLDNMDLDEVFNVVVDEHNALEERIRALIAYWREPGNAICETQFGNVADELEMVVNGGDPGA